MYDLYTIGYCSFSQDQFLNLMHENKIRAVIDVRANPYSRTFPQYNKENFKVFLNNNKIYYLSFAAEFGGRINNGELLSNEIYDLIINSDNFKNGCMRLTNGLSKYNVCLVCAQKDPIICHRSILIAHNFQKLHPDLEIKHIWPNHIETQQELNRRVLKLYLKQQNNLFNNFSNSQQDILDEAYRFQFQNTCA